MGEIELVLSEGIESRDFAQIMKLEGRLEKSVEIKQGHQEEQGFLLKRQQQRLV